jgi:hypothetical protein
VAGAAKGISAVGKVGSIASNVDDADKLYRTAAPVFRPMPGMTTGTYRSTQSYNIGNARIGAAPVSFEEMPLRQQFQVRAYEAAIRDAKDRGLVPETYITPLGTSAPLTFKPDPTAKFPVGNTQSQMNVKGTNSPTTINGRYYVDHALPVE